MGLEVNKEYQISKIDEFADKNNYSVEELGNYLVGENFLVLRHNDKDLIISALLTGSTSNGGIYKIIHSDI